MTRLVASCKFCKRVTILLEGMSCQRCQDNIGAVFGPATTPPTGSFGWVPWWCDHCSNTLHPSNRCPDRPSRILPEF